MRISEKLSSGVKFAVVVKGSRACFSRSTDDHLETHNLLEPLQSAYRKCHSTETALLRVVNDLLQASDDGHVSILSLLDLAIDTIDRVTLNQRFSCTFDCTGTVLGWFESCQIARSLSR